MGVKIRQKDGKWYVFINHHGKRKAKCIGDSKRAAEEVNIPAASNGAFKRKRFIMMGESCPPSPLTRMPFLPTASSGASWHDFVKRKLEAKLTLGEFALQDDKPQVPSFGEYAEHWLSTYAKHNCKESTYTRYAGVIRNYLMPVFGSTSLTDITREDVKRLIYHQRETTTLTPSSIRQILAPLRGMLNHAVEDNVLASNPAARVGRFLQQRKAPVREIDPLTREELALFLATVQEHAPAYYPFFLCLARTGMRLGEALALQWGDIDWHSRFVEIRRGYTLGKITSPKNGKTRRVDLSQQLTEVLHSLLIQH